MIINSVNQQKNSPRHPSTNLKYLPYHLFMYVLFYNKNKKVLPSYQRLIIFQKDGVDVLYWVKDSVGLLIYVGLSEV